MGATCLCVPARRMRLFGAACLDNVATVVVVVVVVEKEVRKCMGMRI